jgi:hypothetical protein
MVATLMPAWLGSCRPAGALRLRLAPRPGSTAAPLRDRLWCPAEGPVVEAECSRPRGLPGKPNEGCMVHIAHGRTGTTHRATHSPSTV